MGTHVRRTVAALLLLASCLAHAQQPASTSTEPWWKHAVIYEIYPRSFQDSDGDGVGDLNGIISRLDYLQQLGVDAIWITPFYPSPQVDFGYDVSDYEAIDPRFGTLADFDRLVNEAGRRHIRVIMDFVINHTSDRHPWFVESRSSRANPKRDWYIWRDGRAPGQPPNNWQSWFGHSAWQFDARTGQYYYHHFYPQQPDLNWRNPQVRDAMYGVVRFWLDRGAAGFRIDAVSRLFEDPGLHDDPVLPGRNVYGDLNIEHKYTDNLPEVHEVLRELRHIVNGYAGHPVLISEADEPNIAELKKMYGRDHDEVQLPMDFQVADVNRLSAPEFRRLLDEVEAIPDQPYFFFSNHDQPRSWDRYGDGVHNDQIAKLIATLLLTTRATPQLYYGEEIGMRTTPPARREDVQDPIGKIGWPREKGRDGERTPMQWDGSRNAAFSSARQTWLPVPPSAAEYNVAREQRDPNSILNFYRRLIALRRSQPALRDGEYAALNRDDPDVLSYLRRTGESAVLVAMNMSVKTRTVRFDVGGIIPLLAAPDSARGGTPADVTLPPFGVVVARVAGTDGEAPANPYIDVGACPFECCTYRQWTARDAVQLLDEPRGKRIVGSLAAGQRVDGLTGEVISTPVPVKARRDIPGTAIKSGDTFYVLHYEGEGEWKAWSRGNTTSVDESDVQGRHPKAEWWVKVKRQDGLQGWAVSDRHFLHQDACE